MSRVLISVTQEDIDAGRASLRMNTFFRYQTCPVARAIIRRLPQYKPPIVVGPDDARLFLGGDKLKLPLRAKKFIMDFDGELDVKPFKFYGEIITPARAAYPNHEPVLSECGCRMCDPKRYGHGGRGMEG